MIRFLGALILSLGTAGSVGALDQGYLDRLREGAAKLGIPGIACAVVEGGTVVLADAVGTALDSSGRPVQATKDTIFGLGSLSKPITARLVRQLAEEGRLDLGWPVVRILPGFRVGDPAVSDTITVRMLLDQRSGFGFTDGHRGFSVPGPTPIPDRLRHPPGERFEYSNWNFNLLGRIASAAGGAPFDQVLREHLTGPWGLTTVPGPFPVGFRRYFGFNVPSPGIPHPEGFRSSAFLSANAIDLGRFLERTLEEGLPEGTLYYQDGWFRSPDTGRELRWHDGMTADFAAFVLLAPSEHSGAVLVANVNDYLGSPPIYRFLENSARDALGLPEQPQVTVPPWPWILGAVLALVLAVQLVWPLGRWWRRPPASLMSRGLAVGLAALWVGFVLGGIPAFFEETFETVAVQQPDLGFILILSAVLAGFGAVLFWVPRRSG